LTVGRHDAAHASKKILADADVLLVINVQRQLQSPRARNASDRTTVLVHDSSRGICRRLVRGLVVTRHVLISPRGACGRGDHLYTAFLVPTCPASSHCASSWSTRGHRHTVCRGSASPRLAVRCTLEEDGQARVEVRAHARCLDGLATRPIRALAARSCW